MDRSHIWGFPGWWEGSRDGRTLSPLVNVTKWDELLHNTRFSGCDSVTPNLEPVKDPMSHEIGGSSKCKKGSVYGVV